MFKHRFWQDVLEVHEIGDGKGNFFRVVPERGGIVAEMALDNRQVFYMDWATLNDSAKNVRGGNPVLFPICGPLEEGRYSWAGQCYQMAQHGLARRMPWEIADTGGTETGGYITLLLKSNPETNKFFPFDFELEFRYELSGNVLMISQRYSNLSPEPMPFYAGFHPYFAISDKSSIELRIGASSYYDLISGCGNTETKNGVAMPALSDEGEVNVVFKELQDREASFLDKSTNCEVKVRYDNNFTHLVIWTQPNKPFLCLEPWMADNYSLNTETGMKWLQPRQELEAAVAYEFLKL